MKDLTVREFNGVSILPNKDGMVSLTDLWKASGGDKSKDTEHWLRNNSTTQFIDAVATSVNTPKSGVIKSTKGRNGGTWAHQQIALAYAKYLSPELHMYVNSIFFERIEENNDPELALNRSIDRVTKGFQRKGKTDEWIRRRLRSSVATKENNKILASHGQNQFVHSLCADAINKEIVGSTAKKFKEINNLPKSAKVPDYLDEIQLVQYELTRLVSMKTIVNNDVRGNKPCADVHTKVAHNIVNACEVGI